MQLKALSPIWYGGRRLQAGDFFEAGSRDARVLVAIGRAELARPAAEPVEVPLVEELVEAPLLEVPAVPEPAEAPKPRRLYRRRDMVADS